MPQFGAPYHPLTGGSITQILLRLPSGRRVPMLMQVDSSARESSLSVWILNSLFGVAAAPYQTLPIQLLTLPDAANLALTKNVAHVSQTCDVAFRVALRSPQFGIAGVLGDDYLRNWHLGHWGLGEILAVSHLPCQPA